MGFEGSHSAGEIGTGREGEIIYIYIIYLFINIYFFIYLLIYLFVNNIYIICTAYNINSNTTDIYIIIVI